MYYFFAAVITLIASAALANGLRANHTLYCGSHGAIPASVSRSNSWKTNNSEHCRQICFTAANASDCNSWNYNATSRTCSFFSNTLEQNGYMPRPAQPNVTWHDRACFPRPCYRYCSFAQQPQPITWTGQPQLDPSFDLGDDYSPSLYNQRWDGLDGPPLRMCEANAFPYDGVGFVRLDSNTPYFGPTNYFNGDCFAQYDASIYYRLANLTLNKATKNPSCRIDMISQFGGDSRTFNLKTTAPMPKYKMLNVTNVPVDIDGGDALGVSVSCTDGSHALVDIDRFVWNCHI